MLLTNVAICPAEQVCLQKMFLRKQHVRPSELKVRNKPGNTQLLTGT